MKKDTDYFDGLAKLLKEHDVKALYLNAVSQKDAERQLLLLAAAIRKKNPALFEPFKTPDEYKNLKDVLADIEKAVRETDPRRPQERGERQEQKKNESSYAGTFQRYFQELIKTQGNGASPEHTARYLLEKMPGPQLQNLKQSLDSLGIHNQKDFSRLLSKWKEEALMPQAQAQERKRELPVRRDNGFNR
jgi:hypothetical protein